MLLEGMFENAGVSILDRVIGFTAERQKLLANNIANIDTPGYKIRDLDIKRFQEDLKKAIESRNTHIEFSSKIDYDHYLLFHDGNNRSIDKLMTSAAKNALLHNVSVELLRSRYNLLEKAVALRP